MPKFNFLKELKKRNIYKIALTYIITAWLLLQLSSILLPAFEAPIWVMKTITLLLIIGFPITILIAWAFELTPNGIVKTTTIKGDDDNQAVKDAKGERRKSRSLNKIIIISLTLAILFLLLDKFYLNTSSKQNNNSTIVKASIAVLPFEDMSADKNQEYFGDGIAEEILNNIAQLNELKVAGRTSSFSYKRKNATIKEIGEALGVDHILEGSVRKQNDQLRITAQLINVNTGYHLWSKQYDRELKDIFKIQDELAQSIGKELLNTLAPKQIAMLTTATKSNEIKNSEAYDSYLKGKYFHHEKYLISFDSIDYMTSERYFLKAIELDSTLALAHAGLADLYDTQWDFTSHEDTITINRLEHLKKTEINKANSINPNLSYVNVVNGWIARNQKTPNTDLAHKYFLKAYNINPNSGMALIGLAIIYGDVGLFEDAIKLSDKAILLDPLNLYFLQHRARFYNKKGQHNLAIKDIETSLEINQDNPLLLFNLFKEQISLKQYEAALLTSEKFKNEEPFLNADNFKAVLAALNGDAEMAIKLDPDSRRVYYILDQQEKLDTLVLKRLDEFKNHPDFNSTSLYYEFKFNPYFQRFTKYPEFNEFVEQEKVKYDALLKKYPRAEKLLGITKKDI